MQLSDFGLGPVQETQFFTIWEDENLRTGYIATICISRKSWNKSKSQMIEISRKLSNCRIKRDGDVNEITARIFIPNDQSPEDYANSFIQAIIDEFGGLESE